MKNMNLRFCLSLFCLLLFSYHANAQINLGLYQEATNGLSFRSIGPAMMGGRIADIAVNPKDKSNWYIAVGSGGVWKTTNSGVTFLPVFDQQKSYSIGTVTIDPNNTNVVWVGTGENVSGRHVGWGDGIYRSQDGGKSWMNMGLSESEHLSKILIDPRDSKVIYVAAEGPLWSSGGQRGLYKSTDGGHTWNLSLSIDENTGVTDVEFDPSNPSVLYAAAYKRRRKTWSLLAGGQQSGIYKSTDGGENWKEVTKGLPSADMGKIGIATTKADPNWVYATIEANDGQQGFYRSTDKGESWQKMNGYISGGTGPHYYQEIEASQTDPELVYQMDVFLHVTRDGGNTFDYLTTGRDKHSDNHALWIDPDNGKHLLAGSDGGLYETFDQGRTWRFFQNLPISQFYKIGLDNSEPFYHIVAGAQDLGTLIGPSRTTHTEGIRNSDWYVPLGADGYDSQFDPQDPNTAYIEIQGGELYRLDRNTEELIKIKPTPAPDDEPERFNWDSPITISPHNSQTIYFGSQRLWKSTDRGDSWKAISKDLTTNTNRYELDMINKVPSIDALYDNGAMSLYATLTSIAVSPVKEGLVYTGSDDGMLYVTENDGQDWRRMKALPDLPERSFINDIEPSQHNEGTLFVAADAHKHGDYKPYLFISENNGRNWKSIVGDLPSQTIVWSLKQDHINENLLFIGTEYGVYFSPNKGKNWIQLASGLPTIACRDIEIHPRDNDLVASTFGRGIYVLDDYSSLRKIGQEVSAHQHTALPVRDAWWYIPSVPYQAQGMPSQGSSSFRTPNPEFGALINYYVSEVSKTLKQRRTDLEKAKIDNGESVSFPGWDQLTQESKQDMPKALLLIKDSTGKPIRWLEAQASKGMHRISWDLRLPVIDPISFYVPDFVPPWAGNAKGALVAPGEYSVQLFMLIDGRMEAHGAKQSFQVKPIPSVQKKGGFQELVEFQQMGTELSRMISIEGQKIATANDQLRYMEAALVQTPSASTDLFAQIKMVKEQLAELNKGLYGDRIKGNYNESSIPGIAGRLGNALWGSSETTSGPTKTQLSDYKMAQDAYKAYLVEAAKVFKAFEAIEQALQMAGAPYTPGRKGR